MSSCCELPKAMHSRDKVRLTGMHDRQELDGSRLNEEKQIETESHFYMHFFPFANTFN